MARKRTTRTVESELQDQHDAGAEQAEEVLANVGEHAVELTEEATGGEPVRLEPGGSLVLDKATDRPLERAAEVLAASRPEDPHEVVNELLAIAAARFKQWPAQHLAALEELSKRAAAGANHLRVVQKVTR